MVCRERTVKDNAVAREQRQEIEWRVEQQHCELGDNVVGVDPVTLPTAWTPGNQRTGCLGCSGSWSGVVARRTEIP